MTDDRPGSARTPRSRTAYELTLILGTVPVGLIFFAIHFDNLSCFAIGLSLILLWCLLVFRFRRRPLPRKSGDGNLNERFSRRPKPTADDARLSEIARREELRHRSRAVRSGPQWMRVNRMFARYRLPSSQPVERSARRRKLKTSASGEPTIRERLEKQRKPIQLSLPVWIITGTVAGMILGGWVMSTLGWGVYSSQPALPWLRAFGVCLMIFWLLSGIRPEPFEPPRRRGDRTSSRRRGDDRRDDDER